jgi:hypothetical protein
MDDKVFFANRLAIYYAPEFESPQDIRDKFNDRFQTIQKRCRKSNASKKKRFQKNHHSPSTKKDTPLFPSPPPVTPSSSISPFIKEEENERTPKRRRI